MITKLAILASLAIFSLIAITPSSFAAEPYVSGSIVTSDEYLPWDRYIDVNGLRILGLPSLDGGNAVSDEFMEKVARTVQLLLDPNAPGIDPAAQMAAMNGMANNCSREGGYPQGLDPNWYGITLQLMWDVKASKPGINIGKTSEAHRAIDFVIQTPQPDDNGQLVERNEHGELVVRDADGSEVNTQINEVLEHLLHTFNHFAFPVAYPVELNIQTPEGQLWEAMQEAIANNVYGISSYADADDGSNQYYALLMQEYSWWLILAEWDYINKYYPDREAGGVPLSPEWADNSRTPAGVAANNPLGHALYQNYLSKIVAKPSSGILDAMYAVDGASGYTATSTGRGSVEPVDCTVESSADSIAESSSSSSEIPDWIKNNAGWWADGQIDDGSFVSGIQWLISNGIMSIPPTEQGAGSDDAIPSWVKNNAGWWADGQIDDNSFVSGLQWLISNGIMILTQETAEPKPEVKSVDLTISSPPNFEKYFTKYVDVFGVLIYATASTPDDKVLHAANVLAQYLDNDADGIPDNPLVVEKLKITNSAVPMFLNGWENDNSELWDDYSEDLDCWTVLTGDEVNWRFSEHMNDIDGTPFDASLEEILHVITQCGYAEAYPEIFGEYQGSLIAEYMDNARGGYFEWVPGSYPADAWYRYHDNSCEYNCMITEYFYWSLTSILGAQDNRWDVVYSQWKPNTEEKVMEIDPDIYNLLTDPQYKLPTILPDGNYQG